jgi:hypothetical protein
MWGAQLWGPRCSNVGCSTVGPQVLKYGGPSSRRPGAFLGAVIKTADWGLHHPFDVKWAAGMMVMTTHSGAASEEKETKKKKKKRGGGYWDVERVWSSIRDLVEG